MELGLAPPVNTGRTPVDGARALSWAEWGPTDGTPVLFFSGAAMGSGLGFGADVVARRDIRLIAVDRPGIGRSDAHPSRTLSTWVDDVRALVAALGLDRPRIVGYSMGSPYALACAAGGVAAAVAVVAGQDDVTHPATHALLTAEFAGLVDAVTADPDAVEAAFARDADASMILRLAIDGSSEHDRAFFTSPSFEHAYRGALDEGFAQGGAGYARDFVLAVAPWPFTVEQIVAPVDLWYGRLDTSTVHSPDLGVTLARRMPHARHRVVADAGSSVLWTHADEILTALLERPTPA